MTRRITVPRGFRDARVLERTILVALALAMATTACVASPNLADSSRQNWRTIVLKGAGTLVGARGRTPGVCERGNPGMATAGTGDVLTGAIAGILAQCHDHWAAARVGVLVHAMAGDAAARAGERGVLAGDLTRELHHCVNL